MRALHHTCLRIRLINLSKGEGKKVGGVDVLWHVVCRKKRSFRRPFLALAVAACKKTESSMRVFAQKITGILYYNEKLGEEFRRRQQIDSRSSGRSYQGTC
jgi:hypothetical protein